MTPTRCTLIRIAVAGLVAATAACGARTPPHPASAGPAPPSAVDLTTLRDAERVLVRDCMRARGFDLPAEGSGPALDNRDFPYAVTDVAWARTHGYGTDIRLAIARTRQADPATRYLDSLTGPRRAAALAAVNGSPADPSLSATLPGGGVVRRSATGCTSTAEQRLYGDIRTWYRVSRTTDNLAAQWTRSVLVDPAFRAAVGPWSACMRRAGFDAPDPPSARRAATAPGVPRATEIRTAVAEATCAGSTGLTATAAGLEDRYRAAVEAKYRADLDTRHRLEQAALPLARSLTGSVHQGR